MLATRTTQQQRLKMLLRLFSFVGVVLVLALYSNSTSAGNTISKTDCGKTVGGTKLACTLLGDEAIFDVPLDIYKYGFEVKRFFAKDNTSSGSVIKFYSISGVGRSGDKFFIQLNVAPSRWADPNWKTDARNRCKIDCARYGELGPLKKIKVKGGYGRLAEFSNGTSLILALNWSKQYRWTTLSKGQSTKDLLDMFATGSKNSPAELMASKNMHAGGNSSSTSVTTKSAEYRACQTAKGDSSKTAKFMQSLTQSQLTKFLNKNQSCDAF